CAAGERRHAFGGEVGGEAGCCFFFLSGLEGLHFVDPHVGGGDEADGFDGGILRAGVAGHESAHAVADEDDVGGFGAEFFRVDGDLEGVHGGGVGFGCGGVGGDGGGELLCLNGQMKGDA